MTDMNLDLARFNMVEQQVRTWDVLNPDVLDALGQVPREDFVPADYRRLAYADIEIPIGNGEVMLKPIIVARGLQALDIQPDDKVLEIGAGTGYASALLAKLAQQVHAVEIDHALFLQARTNITTQGIHNVIMHEGDATREMDWGGPFDAILVGGSFPAGVPTHLQEQLKVGGRLFAVIGDAPLMQGVLIRRVSENEWQQEALFETSVPALRNVIRPVRFEL